MCELAAGFRFCCPESNVLTEFLRKKTDWETADCSMHLLVSQKAQAGLAPSHDRGSPWQPGTALGEQPLTRPAETSPARLCPGLSLTLSPGQRFWPGTRVRAGPGSSVPSPSRPWCHRHGQEGSCPPGWGLPGTGTAQHSLSAASSDGKHSPSGAVRHRPRLPGHRRQLQRKRTERNQDNPDPASSEQGKGVLENRHEVTHSGHGERSAQAGSSDPREGVLVQAQGRPEKLYRASWVF